jgi:hypothetical protein
LTATHPALLADDYKFCQMLGVHGRKVSIGAYLSTSARHQIGCNTVVFRPDVIREEQKVCDYRYFMSKDRKLQFQRIEMSMPISVEVPSSWNT